MGIRLKDAMKNYQVTIFLMNGALLIYCSLCWSKKKMGQFILKVLIWTLKMLKARNDFKTMWKVSGQRDCFPLKRKANEDGHKNMFVMCTTEPLCADVDRLELCIMYRRFVDLKYLKNWDIIINYQIILMSIWIIVPFKNLKNIIKLKKW